MEAHRTNTLILAMDHADYAPECIVVQLQRYKVYVADTVLLIPRDVLASRLYSGIQGIAHEHAVETLNKLICTTQSHESNVHLCIDVQSRLLFAQCLIAAQTVLAETDCVWGVEHAAETITLVTLPLVLLRTFRAQTEVKLLPSQNDVDTRATAFYATLSEEEQQLVALTAKGLTNRALAEHLHRSESAVANTLTGIYKRIQRTALVKNAAQVDRKTVIHLFRHFSE